MKNIAFEVMGDMLVAVYSEANPTSGEHAECVGILKKLDLRKMRVLILSKGGAPTPAQRKELNDIVQGHDIPVAVMTTSTLARGVTTALSWFNKNMKAYSPDQMEEAFRHLNVPSNKLALVRSLMIRLDAEVGQKRSM